MNRVASIRRSSRRDDGSMLPLTMVYGALGLLVVLVVVAASSLYLERKRLYTLADGAALVGAEAFTLGASGPALETPDVAAAVSGYLEVAPTGEFQGLQLDRAESADGRSATVQLSSYWRPPVLTLVVPEGIRIDVTAVARAVFE